MSVYKPKNSPHYHYDFQFKGDRFCGSCETANRREAEKLEDEKRDGAKTDYERTKRAAGGPLTVEAAFERYWNEVGKFHERADQTGWSLDWLKKELGGTKRIRDIADTDVAEIVARRRGEPVRNVAAERGRRRRGADSRPMRLVGPARVNRSVTEPLRKVLTRARDLWGQEVQKVKWSKHLLEEPEERVREASADEEARAFAELPPQYHAPARYSLRMGERLTSCAVLERGAVDWGERTVTRVVKGGKTRVTPLPTDMRDMLWALSDRHPTRFFVRDNGEPITASGLVSAWKRALKRAGVSNLHFHDLRHTAATRLLRRTGNLKMTQKLLGHRNIKSTLRYAHVLDEDLRNAMDAMASEQKRAQSPEKSPEQPPNYLNQKA